VIAVRVDTDTIDEAFIRLGALPEQIEAASNAVTKRTRLYARDRLVDEIASDLGVAKTKIKSYRAKLAPGLVWLGYNPLKAAYCGRLTQDARGAFAGQFYFAGAFVATMKSGHKGVYKRAGKSRLPIVEQTVTVRGMEAANDVAQQVETYYKEQMTIELQGVMAP
jgi:hypothetical protein